MQIKATTPDKIKCHFYRNYFFIAMLLWTLLISLMGAFDFYTSRKNIFNEAIIVARQNLAKDLLFRRWVSDHGGVYVPLNDKNPANPYLIKVPEREITTPSGRVLTLLNPAYANRQLHEMGNKELGIQGHLTSLKPIRPENAPDLWETKALCILSGGENEYIELTQIGDKPYLRLITAIKREESCYKCHPKDTDLTGGLSISVPWDPYLEQLIHLTPTHLIGYGGIWLIGVLGLFFARFRFKKHINEIARIEDYLRRGEIKYRLLAEGIAAIPWEFDLINDRWDYIGPQAKTMLGIPPEEWTNLAFWANHIHEDDRERAINFCQIQTESGLDHDFEYRFTKKDGTIAWLRDVVSVELVDGRPVRLRGVMIDITSHRQTEERLRQTSKMEAVGTLAAGVAHDFNNILTSLVSFATLAKKRHKEDPITSDFLKEILDGANRAAELTRGLLAYSRKQETRVRSEELNEIILRHQKMLRRMVRADIELQVQEPSKLLPLLADRAQLEQVLMNLVINAQDAMPDGGTIKIETSIIQEEQRQRFPALNEFTGDAWALLMVSDTGSGITPENLNRIFDPFFTTKEVGKGTGLGLSIAQGVIRQHDGQIQVESAPGQGTTFLIVLPLSETQAEHSNDGKADSDEPAGKGETILLAEDEPQVRKVLKHMLEERNYQILVAANGEEAVNLFQQNRKVVAMVILDVMMPTKNGEQALAEMRTFVPGLKALLISGYHDELLNDQQGKKENFLEKPLDTGKLLQEIRRILEQ